MPMIDPPHSGEIVREECLVPLGLSVTDGAKALGVTRQALNNLVNEKTGISPEMAIRLEKAFGSSADMWLKLQTGFELANARKRAGEIAVERYVGRRIRSLACSSSRTLRLSAPGLLRDKRSSQ